MNVSTRLLPFGRMSLAVALAWTRGGHFCYAKAKNAAALDAFMSAFPY